MIIHNRLHILGHGLEVRGQVQGLVNWSLRTRTFKNTALMIVKVQYSNREDYQN